MKSIESDRRIYKVYGIKKSIYNSELHFYILTKFSENDIQKIFHLQ